MIIAGSQDELAELSALVETALEISAEGAQLTLDDLTDKVASLYKADYTIIKAWTDQIDKAIEVADVLASKEEGEE